MADPEQYSFGDFRLRDWLVQPRLNRISSGDLTFTLELKVMQVLVCLAKHAGDLVTRQQLTDSVWATEFISDNTVTHAVTELRNALGDDAKSPTYIETIHRQGYRLVALVERSGEKGQQEDQRAGTGKPRWPHVLAVAVAAIIGLLVILSPEVLFERRGDEPAEEPIPRIVVLPFDNLGSPEDEYFADGITEEINSRLAAVSGLQVISRTSAMHYKGRQLPVKQIGEELDVGFVLEGTIRWDRGDEGFGRVRITPQLIRVADDSHLWSDRYDRVLEDIFEVQSDIAGQVIAKLEATILHSERRAVEMRPTDDMDAYQAYLLGVQHTASFGEADMRLSVKMFERAVELDPDFALAYAWLSEEHSRLYFLRHDYSGDRVAKAKASVQKALEVQPGLPEGHRALGYFYYWCHRDYDKALEHFAVAAENLPNDPRVLRGEAYVYRRQGGFGEALEKLEKVQQLDPWDHRASLFSAVIYRFLRDFKEAEREYLRVISIAPHLAEMYGRLALMYVAWDGSTERARRVLEGAPSTDPQQEFDWYFIVFDLFDRQPESALARLKSIQRDTFSTQVMYEPRSLLECKILFQMGDAPGNDAACRTAIELLEKELDSRPDDFRLHSALGTALALVGLTEESIREGEHAAKLMPISRDADVGTRSVAVLAQIYTRVGEADKALDLIEKLLSNPGWLSVGLLRLDPVWDPLRDHSRFQALLEKYDTN